MLLSTLSKPTRNYIPQGLIKAYSEFAFQAMMTEVELTPKPGLVDADNCGAHQDMTRQDFYASAQAIKHYLPHFIEIGANNAANCPQQTLTSIRSLGLECEQEMLDATQGVNTHKGSIFSLGLLCAAIGRLYCNSLEITPEAICHTVSQFCKDLCYRELRQYNPRLTAGQRLYHQFGLTGARGQAESGYSMIIQFALPHYLNLIHQGISTQFALLETLLLLISKNDDTNVASRGGIEALQWMQNSATTLLKKGGIRNMSDIAGVYLFDQACITRNLSPGGSADLLIITCFLAEIQYYNQTYKSQPVCMENAS